MSSPLSNEHSTALSEQVTGTYGRTADVTATSSTTQEKEAKNMRVLPVAHSPESEERKQWFESFFERIPVEGFLPLASAARTDRKCKCRFGGRAAGSYNVALFLIFEDGVEWVVKIPKMTRDFGEQEYLMSEYATLVFLGKIKHVPAPKVHGFSFDCKNSVKTAYFFMDKVPGTSFYNALKNGLSRTQIYNTLRELAQIKKTLMEHPFYQIGSLSIMDNDTCEYDVDRHRTLSGYNDYIQDKSRCTGPYRSSLQYYADLLHVGWLEWHDYCLLFDEPEVVREQWKIHTYLCSVLDSYVNDGINQFFLAHTDLTFSNFLVDENGSITGIIDWEFASTLPLQSADHYPLFLADEQKFVVITEDIYSNPLTELQEWRDFYAKQFVGNSVMEKYLRNIETMIAFESILRDYKEVTVDSLVDKFKFLNSKSTLDHIGIPFPWKEPTKSHLESISSTVVGVSEEQTRDRLSSESPSLNDFVVQPSRFSKFVNMQNRKVGNISGRMKGGLNAIWEVLRCRKQDKSPKIEMT